MKHLVITLTTLIATTTIAAASGPVVRADRPVDNRFIVVFEDSAARGPAEPKTEMLPDVAALAEELAARHDGVVRRSFGHAFKGAVVEMTMDQAETLARHPSVALVEEDGIVSLQGTQADPPSWGLDRIDQRAPYYDAQYSFTNTGTGIDVYVLDTGIRSTHLDFGDRVDTTSAFTAINDGNGTEDCHGHGTMVAGIIGGSAHGVAKEVRLHPVRVLGCTGSGTTSNLVAGLDWVAAQRTTSSKGHGKKRPSRDELPPAVANISVAGAASGTVDAAVDGVIAAGVVVVAAAGNNTWDACNYSPARVPAAITVGASSEADNVWTYSNAGPCVDVFAPGVEIPAPFNGSDSDSTWLTGTSAAAPHVAGLAALYLASDPDASPDQVASWVVADSTTGILGLVPPDTQSRLLFTGNVGADRAPTASFRYSCRSTRCTFDGSLSADDNGIVSFDWDFGDGTTGAGETARHKFTAGSTYVVTLTVTDAAGQTSSAIQYVPF